MTVTVNFTGLEPIADAINHLAQSLGASGFVTTVRDKSSAAVAPVQPQTPVPAPVQSAPLTPQPQVPQTPAPVVQAPTVPAQQSVQPPVVQPVPTTTQSYTLDDIARAAMILMDSGRQGDLLGLLASFGVEALPALPQAQYGAFATALRSMGAQI